MTMTIMLMLGLLAFAGVISSSWAQDTSWFLGSGIDPNIDYYYAICDYEYQFVKNTSDCYDLMLSFKDMLHGPYGSVWLAQAKIKHGTDLYNAILYIDPVTFETKSVYAANRKYAESIERTLFWSSSTASEYNPMTLVVGKSWGNLPLYYGFESEMLVRKKLSLETPTYEVGYPKLKMIIQDGFPFPLQINAKNHSPSSSDRFFVTLSDGKPFDIIKNHNVTFKPIHDADSGSTIANVTMNKLINKSSQITFDNIDPETFRVLSILYDTILNVMKNTTTVSQLIP